MNQSNALKNLLEQSPTCANCGLCLDVCPTYRQSGREADSPRGRLAILRAMLSDPSLTKEAQASLQNCTRCGRCEKACPRWIPIVRIFTLADTSKPPFGRQQLARIYGMMLAHPVILSSIQLPLAMAQRLFKKNQPAITFVMRPYKQTRKPQTQAQAVLFGGCIAQRIFPEIIQAADKCLEYHHIEYIIPDTVCCGAAMETYHMPEARLKLLRKNLACLAKLEFEYLLTLCPKCLRQIQEVWPHISGVSSEEKDFCRHLAGKIMDINTFLADKTRALPETTSKSHAFWHKPCLMADTDAQAAIRLISRQYTLRSDMDSGCCGSPLSCRQLGLYKKAPPDLEKTRQMGDKIAKSARKIIAVSGANTIVTACPACKIQFSRFPSLGQAPIQVKHPLEIYAQIISKENSDEAM